MPRIPISDATLAVIAAFALNLLVAILILAIGWVAAGWVQRLLRRALARVERLDATLRLLLASVARYAVLAFAVLAASAQLGIQTASLLALVGAAGLAIGLALQGALAIVAAGLMILLLRPFQVGDRIEAAPVAGRIDEIGLFTIELTTEDGVYLSVPNTRSRTGRSATSRVCRRASSASRCVSTTRTISSARSRCCVACWTTRGCCPRCRPRSRSPISARPRSR